MGTKLECKFCERCKEIVTTNKITPNHRLHLLLTLLTGFWIIIWLLIILLSSKEKSHCSRCGAEIG